MQGWREHPRRSQAGPEAPGREEGVSGLRQAAILPLHGAEREERFVNHRWFQLFTEIFAVSRWHPHGGQGSKVRKVQRAALR